VDYIHTYSSQWMNTEMRTSSSSLDVEFDINIRLALARKVMIDGQTAFITLETNHNRKSMFIGDFLGQ
jgi:hypothetical protein